MRTITFVRHAKADPAKIDSQRMLSEKGREQAAALREKLGAPVFDLVLASSAQRTMSTAAIVAGCEEGQVFPVDLMYPDPEKPEGKPLDKLFNELGYAPLTTYFTHLGGYLVRQHGKEVWKLLQGMIGDAENVLVVGHAVLLPAAAFIGTEWRESIAYLISELNMGECEGFRLTFEFYGWKPMEFEKL